MLQIGFNLIINNKCLGIDIEGIYEYRTFLIEAKRIYQALKY
jgi:hypothetical protein